MPDRDFLKTSLSSSSLPIDGRLLIPWGYPGAHGVVIICSQTVIEHIEAHSQSNTDEVGGILIGEHEEIEDFVAIFITDFIPAESRGKDQQSRVHFNFSPEIWTSMLQVKDRDFDEKSIVGWFHSHPDHGIFLSEGMDTVIHGSFFNQIWQTALVYDPERNQAGFFIWEDGEITRAKGFFEYVSGKRKISKVTWTNWIRNGNNVEFDPLLDRQKQEYEEPDLDHGESGAVRTIEGGEDGLSGKFARVEIYLSRLIVLIIIAIMIGILIYFIRDPEIRVCTEFRPQRGDWGPLR